MSFAKKFKAIRKRLGLTAAQAAQAINPALSRRTVESWEGGLREPPEWVQALIFERLKK